MFISSVICLTLRFNDDDSEEDRVRLILTDSIEGGVSWTKQITTWMSSDSWSEPLDKGGSAKHVRVLDCVSGDGAGGS